MCTILKHVPVKTGDEETWNNECPKPYGICLQEIPIIGYLAIKCTAENRTILTYKILR